MFSAAGPSSPTSGNPPVRLATAGTPQADGVTSIALNGSAITPPVENGYAVIARSWKAGDKEEKETKRGELSMSNTHEAGSPGGRNDIYCRQLSRHPKVKTVENLLTRQSRSQF